MSYTRSARNRNTNNNTNRGGQVANVELAINTPDGDYLCTTNKIYTEKSSVIQDLDTNIIKISTFDKNLGALTIQNAKAKVIKNYSDTCAEIFITVHD